MAISVQTISRKTLQPAFNVQIVSTEIIKPSSPTLNHLRTYKLSVVDQLLSDLYGGVVLFYSPMREDLSKTSDFLKKALSETLTHFYPLAGRIKDRFSVDCNDYGAEFIEACVSCKMSEFLEQPDMEKIRQMIPFGISQMKSEISSQKLLVVQVNYFNRGGMALGVCIWHGLTDGSAAAYFIKIWTAVARGENNKIDENLVIDCSSLFPPQNLNGFSATNFYSNPYSSSNTISKRFLFDGKKIADFREKVGRELGFNNVTRVAVVSTLIWDAFIGTTQDKERTIKNHISCHLVNLRNRINPPLPQRCMGNIVHFGKAEWTADKAIEFKGLVREIMQSIRKENDAYMREICSENGIVNSLKHIDEIRCDSSLFWFTSLCRFPFYEVDFGWGRPVWFSPIVWGDDDTAYLFDARDGEGIKAWVALSEEDMEKFEQNPSILAYASFSPSIEVFP